MSPLDILVMFFFVLVAFKALIMYIEDWKDEDN